VRYVSLFSGIEAASCAWAPLGWETVAFAEVEPFPCAVLAARFPEVPNLGDVAKVDWRPYAGAVDVVVGGSPCQAFSLAGNRRGLMDPRGQLMLEYVRAVGEIRPRWILWENVPGVLSQDGGRAFGTLLGELEELGYSLAWRVLDAQYFGVAQRRRRVFVVGHLGADVGPAAAVLFEPDCLRGDNPPGREKRAQLAAAAEGGAGGSYTLKLRHTGSDNPGGGSGPLIQDDVSATLATRQDQVLFQPAEGCLTPWDAQSNRVYAADGPFAALAANENGGMNRQAVCIPINGQLATRDPRQGDGMALGVGEDGDPAFTVTASHPHAVCYQQNQRDEVRAVGGDGQVAGALTAQPGAKGVNFVAYAVRTANAGANGCGVQEELAHALDRSGPEAVAVTQYGEEVAGTLTARADSSPCADRGQNIVCVASTQARAAIDEDMCGTLSARSDRDAPVVASGYVVRRLTPLECERLQGFPDNWTEIEFRGRPAADAPRYKALGNSMAVPCMRWIGERIAEVDAILREVV